MLQIVVKTPSGRTITLDVEWETTFNEIKRKIQDKEGVAPENQELGFDGVPLRKDEMSQQLAAIRNRVTQPETFFDLEVKPNSPDYNMFIANETKYKEAVARTAAPSSAVGSGLYRKSSSESPAAPAAAPAAHEVKRTPGK